MSLLSKYPSSTLKILISITASAAQFPVTFRKHPNYCFRHGSPQSSGHAIGHDSDQLLPYATSFDKDLKDAATTGPEERQAKTAELLKRMDARSEHPTFDHLLPIFVGVGAAK